MSERRPHRVGMLALPDSQILDVVGPLEVFSHAERHLARTGAHRRAYEVELLGLSSKPVTTSLSVSLEGATGYGAAKRIDTLLVAGGRGVEEFEPDDALVRWLRRRARTCRRAGSVCTGALLLARCGLLEGRRVTTHWRFSERLQQLAPNATVLTDAIFLRDGSVYTSAGVTAGMDLALALVEEDWGREVALEVARELVMYAKRAGGQSQFSSELAMQMTEEARFRDLQAWILENLASDLSVTVLARQVHMSTRNFSRAFRRETGVPPAHYVERGGLEEARRMLTATAASILEVALDTGFGNAERLRRSFRRHFRVSPSEYRKWFR